MATSAKSPEDPDEDESLGLRLLLLSLATTIVFHGALLPFTHGNTYDAYIHMFFGDHYHRSWFDPWEPRWYTGFNTTSYPPGTHMAIGALMHVMPLRAAFVVVQLFGLILLTVGLFRFARLWVPSRAAGYATIALVLASSISETVHLFGQLPTIFSLGIFLNGLPYVYRWIAFGGWGSFAAAVVFAAATTAAHHVTTIFGGVLFIGPLAFQALNASLQSTKMLRPGLWSRVRRYAWPVIRAIGLGACMVLAIVVTVFPYWYWSVSDPITQVPIPHGSRESFIDRPDLGFIFFLLPWGLSLLFLPYVVYKTVTTRLWPLGLSVLLCFILGTGGTTPIPRMILHGAFDILTLDRFTFWGTILILPFVGLMLDGLLHGRSAESVKLAVGRAGYRLIIGGIFCAMSLIAVFAAILPTIQPTQPRFIDPRPIVQFMSEDEHDRWRYLTLGFGDQFAYLSAQMSAQSVDGNYHSARRLPALTRFSVERLENSKYLGIPGLGSLQQFLVNAERYHLKYVFSNDAFYDPLLHFTGWTRLNRLPNNIVVWEKPDIAPLPLFQSRQHIPIVHTLIWGIVPPLALIAALILLGLRVFSPAFMGRSVQRFPTTLRGSAFTRPHLVRRVILGMAGLAILTGGVALTTAVKEVTRPLTAEGTVARYFEHLDFREFDAAFGLLDPETRPSFEDVMLSWRWRGGLIASFGKLSDIDISPDSAHGEIADWTVKLTWLTGLGMREETLTVRTIRRDARWFLAPLVLRPVQTPVRLQREETIDFNVVGRRQPRADTDLHRDRLDRPRISVSGARLVERDGGYSLVGLLSNTDADPAASTLISSLYGEDQLLVTQAVGKVNGHRLLPAESAGFRIEFEGILSLEDGLDRKAFDPKLFIPPELSKQPDTANIEARALVAGDGLYRGVAINGLTIAEDDKGLVLRGLAVNTGPQTAAITAINVLLYDLAGQPVWAELGFADSNIYPGQSTPVSMRLPGRSEISVVTDVAPEDIEVNGSVPERDLAVPDANTGTIPLDTSTGYSAARLHVHSMTHDPLF